MSVSIQSARGGGYSGGYVPTVTGIANVGSVSISDANYEQQGDVVTVFGHMTIDATTTATATSWSMTLPVASNLSIARDLAGMAVGQVGGSLLEVFAIYGSAASDFAVFEGLVQTAASHVIPFMFKYKVR